MLWSDRKRLASEALTAVSYDPDTLRLLVEFRNGRVYEYEDVPAFTYRALLHAASKGEFFNRCIRDSHPARRLR